MSCVKPLDGYRATGGAVIIVAKGERPPRNATTRTPMSIPCGRCIGCRMEKARQWGMRCLHEKKMWPENSYVTLTYNDAHLPPGGTLVVRDIQLFMKRLRKAREPDKIRFFLGGEYGDKNARPHYHALLFNCGFRDRKYLGTNARGEPLYTSSQLSDLWSRDGVSMGFCTIGEVTFESAVYVAKYALKKVNGDKAHAHYCVFDDNGECFDRLPEFAVMSRNPGIGATYFDKYGSEVIAHDNVIIDGKEVRPPRYYDRRALQQLGDKHNDAAIFCRCPVCTNKRKRKRMSVLNRSDNTEERLRVKEKLMLIAAQKKERKL